MVGHKDFSSHCGSYRENIHAHTKTYIHIKNVLYLEIKTYWNRKILCFSFQRVSKSLVLGENVVLGSSRYSFFIYSYSCLVLLFIILHFILLFTISQNRYLLKLMKFCYKNILNYAYWLKISEVFLRNYINKSINFKDVAFFSKRTIIDLSQY